MMTGKKIACMAAGLTLVAGMATAGGQKATGDEIKAFVSGKTVQGSMLVDEYQKYSEFYMPDGTIKGDGYTGEWSISDDSMCFAYGGQSSGCWQATIEGAAVIWWKDGAVDGAAVAKEGNGNGY